MRSVRILLAQLSFAAVLSGCDGIFSIDNWDPPDSQLTGLLHFNGQPVGVRANSAKVQLWQIEPVFPIEEAITVNVDQNGRFSTIIFDGTYQINVLSGSGAWIDQVDRQEVVVRGNTAMDLAVQPYYTIDNESVQYSSEPAPGGSITASFNVGKHVTTQDLEFVGVYIGTTAIVDRTNKLPIPNSVAERSLSEIQAELDANRPITISIPLPNDIHTTPSPARRNHVHVRIGVKTVGVSEIMFSPLHKVAI